MSGALARRHLISVDLEPEDDGILPLLPRLSEDMRRSPIAPSRHTERARTTARPSSSGSSSSRSSRRRPSRSRRRPSGSRRRPSRSRSRSSRSRSRSSSSGGRWSRSKSPPAKRAKGLRNSLFFMSEPLVLKAQTPTKKQKEDRTQERSAPSRWRPLIGDIVRKFGRGDIDHDQWLLREDEEAIIVEVRWDGGIKLRNPRGLVNEDYFDYEEFDFVRAEKMITDEVRQRHARAIEVAWAQKAKAGTMDNHPSRDKARMEELKHDTNFDSHYLHIQEALVAKRAHDNAFDADSSFIQKAMAIKKAISEGRPVHDKLLKGASQGASTRELWEKGPTHEGEFVWEKAEEMKEMYREHFLGERTDKNDPSSALKKMKNAKGKDGKFEWAKPAAKAKKGKDKKDKKAKKEKKAKKAKKKKKPKLTKTERKVKQAEKELRRANKRLGKLRRGRLSSPSSSGSSDSSSSSSS